MSWKQRLGLLVAVVWLTGCTGLGHVPPAKQRLDLGAPIDPSSQRSEVTATPLVLPSVSAALMLQDVAVIWRIGTDGVPNRYATYEWVAPPNNLVQERLVNRLSSDFAVLMESVSSEDLTLRVNLLQFEQVYAPDGSSNNGVVGLQAVLLRGTNVLAQYRDTITQKAAANDAPSGARALSVATDQIVDKIASWINQVVHEKKGKK